MNDKGVPTKAKRRRCYGIPMRRKKLEGAQAVETDPKR